MKEFNAWPTSTLGEQTLRGRLPAGVVNHLAPAPLAAAD
jgi:hypothetical protein